MTKPWLSVIIPCHYGERWLAAALQSILDQQDDGIEVIFVDGSTDDASFQIAEGFSTKLNIRPFRRSDLLSWMAKTNFGVEQAGAERICTLHQDDIWLPERCAKLREWLQTQPDGVMHLHPCYIIDENGRRLGLWRCPLPADEAPVPAPLLYERLLVQNFIGIPTPTFRRDSYLKAGGLDETLWYTADWDLYLKLAALGKVYYHSDPVACFRVHKNSLTVRGSRDTEDFRAQHQLIMDRYSGRLLPENREKVLKMFNVSVNVNVALAMAVTGKYRGLFKAICSVLSLRPALLRQYVFCSRIVDRAVPRLRALVTGTFQRAV